MTYRAIPTEVAPALVANAQDPYGPSIRAIAVDNTTPFQTDWLGFSANYMGFAAFSDLGLTAAQQTAEFDRAYTSGIKMARTWYGQDWACGNPYGTPDWSSVKQTAFYTWLQAMKDRGIKVILTMGWHFPGNVAAPSVGTIPTDTPTPAQETAWAAWVSESLNQMMNVRNFDNIVACFFFTEPNVSAPHANIPIGYTDLDYYIHLVTIARDKIVSDDASRTPIRSRIKLMGTEEFSYTADTWLEYMKANTSSLFDAYAAHSYCGTPTFAPLGLAANQCLAYTPWNDLFTNWVGDASPQAFWGDEGNTLVGGDDDTTGYRATADAGWQLCRLADGHAQAGCQASFIWTLQDQHWVPASAGYTQQFGVAKWIGDSNAVKPSWYAFSLMANLTGGGLGTKIYRATNTTSTLHATTYWVPLGVRNATNAAGEWTVVIINEGGATGVKVNLTSSIAGRTVYRYTYSGETPPKAATNPAYLLSWDAKYTGVTTQIPANIVAGRSVVIYSTINLATTTENLALQAGVASDSTGYGNPWNVTNGNFSNVLGTSNTWRKADDSSHYVQLTWTALQSFSRIELAFVGTTAGVVYADYATTATPAPLADYTLQYLSPSGVWTDIVVVTANSAPNRTHTFARVTTSSIRLVATSAAATAGVNQIGAYDG